MSARYAVRSWERQGDSDDSWRAFRLYRDTTAPRPELPAFALEHGLDVGLVELWAEERLWAERIEEYDAYRLERLQAKAWEETKQADPLVADIARLQREIVKDQLQKYLDDCKKITLPSVPLKEINALSNTLLKSLRSVEKIEVQSNDDIDLSALSLEEHEQLQQLLSKGRKR